MAFDYTGFKELELTPQQIEYSGEVYILIYADGDLEIPFYVGQSKSFHRRMDDYFWAQISSPTDHKIGTAIVFLCKQGGKVLVRHKRVADPQLEERRWLAALEPTGFLLNGRVGEPLSKCRLIVEHARAEARKRNG
jgi:hypothetical protein